MYMINLFSRKKSEPQVIVEGTVMCYRLVGVNFVRNQTIS